MEGGRYGLSGCESQRHRSPIPFAQAALAEMQQAPHGFHMKATREEQGEG